MTCRCGDVFEDHESLGSDYGMCQMCWEAYCANTWWHMFDEAEAQS
jgi:hypothetical protein